MNDIFRQLAKHLDKLPSGYPSTESGIEIRILKRLFTEEEAALTLNLGMLPEPVSAIAERMGTETEELATKLENMSKKGLIYRSGKGDEKSYMASQFVIGIWEYHLNSLDKELIRDVNEYLPQFMTKSWTKHKTKQLRVIPISKKITEDKTVLPYEVAEEIIRDQSKIVVCDCICRKEHTMMDNGCNYPREVCLSFGSGAYYYEENGLGRSIDTNEALEILETGRKAGLVLQPGNAKKPANICMCCGCCCQVLKNLKTLDNPSMAVHSNYYAVVNEDDCTGCETCIDRCHVDAIIMDDVAVIQPWRCIGCGLCISECPTDAIQYKQKDPEECYEPPANIYETYFNMARERGNI